jgi:hypothetical protein
VVNPLLQSTPRKVGSFLTNSLPALEKAEASAGFSFSGVVLRRVFLVEERNRPFFLYTIREDPDT